jgi:hypothetical protein
LSLDDAMAHVEAFRAAAEFDRENAAWIIASVANIAGAKPKVTIDKLLRRTPPDAPRDEQVRQNAIAAGLLEAIAQRGAPPTPQTGVRVTDDDVERMRADANRPRGEVVARAKPGDAPVPPAIASANMEEFRARMRATRDQIAARRGKPGA